MMVHSDAKGISVPTANAVLGLIERLEAAEAGSRELDGEIHLKFSGDYRILYDRQWTAIRDLSGWTTTRVAFWTGCPAYTSSLDAALALAERVAPDFCLNLTQRRAEKSQFWEVLYLNPKGEPEAANAPNAALAMCLAVLKATAAAETGAVGTQSQRDGVT